MLIDQTHHSKQYYYFDQRIKDCINFIQSNYTYKIKCMTYVRYPALAVQKRLSSLKGM